MQWRSWAVPASSLLLARYLLWRLFNAECQQPDAAISLLPAAS